MKAAGVPLGEWERSDTPEGLTRLRAYARAQGG